MRNVSMQRGHARSATPPNAGESVVAAASGAGRAWRWGLLVAAGIGVALRLASARGDLWLDEIWSVRLAQLCGSAWDVFTKFHHDNNHHLNTLYLYLVGQNRSEIVYRFFAVASGSALVVAAALAPSLRDGFERFAAATLVALSHILTYYASEARGYATAGAALVVAHLALSRFLVARRWRWAALFCGSTILAFLSHLTAVLLLPAFAAQIAWVLYRTRPPRWPLTAAALLGPPIVAFALLWAIDLRGLIVGGGPEYALPDVLRGVLRFTLGLPRGPAELLGLAALAAVAHEMWSLAREWRGEWVFFAVALGVAPFLAFTRGRPEFLAERYFVVFVPFLLILVARFLGTCWRRGTWGKAIAAAALLAFAAGNLWMTVPVMERGRARFREPIERILAASPPGQVTVGSTHDWRGPVILQYYAARLAGSERIVYVNQFGWSAMPPSWIIRDDLSDSAPPPARYVPDSGTPYLLDRQFAGGGMGRTVWSVYRIAE